MLRLNSHRTSWKVTNTSSQWLNSHHNNNKGGSTLSNSSSSSSKVGYLSLPSLLQLRT
jgi:hypothetical protein